MSQETFHVGDDVRCAAAFTNSAGVAVDPTAVICKIRDPEGTVTPKIYGTDAELVRDSAGSYHIDVDASMPGTWWVRFYSTGSGKAAIEESFEVETSKF